MNSRFGIKEDYSPRRSFQAIYRTILILLVFALIVFLVPRAKAQNSEKRPLSEIYGIIEDFIREDYLSTWSSSPRLIRRHYADPMDYYWGKKDVSLKKVLRDKVAYMSRWPQRYFRLVADTLEVTRSKEDPYIYAVKFEYEFETKRRGAQKAGIGETGLLLELFDRRILIRGEGGKVLERY